MPNCFVIYLAGKKFAIFHTEQACENFMTVMNDRTSRPYVYDIRGEFIPDIGF